MAKLTPTDRKLMDIVCFVVTYRELRQKLKGDNKTAAKLALQSLPALDEAMAEVGADLAARWKK